jgi:UDP-N-acetylglucosamine 2-epimerase (non-hydrolysing)
MRLFEKNRIHYEFIHTGQHHDYEMFSKFIRDFKIREPDHSIELKSEGTVQQFAEMMTEIDNVLRRTKPSSVLVVGDTNSVAASALAATKLRVPTIHLEAGLRSYDWRMPEEYNRRMVDHISDVLFSPTSISANNLANELVHGTVHVVGNTVIDAVKLCMQSMTGYGNYDDYYSTGGTFLDHVNTTKNKNNSSDFALLTLHRQENVDNRDALKCILTAISASRLNCICPMHPRTVKRIREFGLESLIPSRVIMPAGYFDFLRLLKTCKFVITDSGGVQEEVTSPYINKRVLVIRNSTERPESILSGHAMLCQLDYNSILKSIRRISALESPKNVSPFGDGNSAQKIFEILVRRPIVPLSAKKLIPSA